MEAQQKSSIYTQDSSIGIEKPGMTTFQWRPATRDGIDQFPERKLEDIFVPIPRKSSRFATMNSTLPLEPSSWEITQPGSLAPQSKKKYSSNLWTILQHDHVTPIILTKGIKLPPIGSAVGTAAKSRKTTDDGDTVWLPQMDGIRMVSPSSCLETNQSCSSAATSTTDHKVKMTEEMLKTENYINFVLYGPRKSKRLPVFEEICPSSLFSDTDPN